MNSPFSQSPGVRTLGTLSYRQILAEALSALFATAFAQIDGSKTRDTANSDDVSLLRAGLLLGKTTSGGKYRNAIIGVVGTAISAATVTSITVPAAVATEIARLIALAGGNVAVKFIGPPTAGGTIATTSVTVTAAAGTTLTVSSVAIPAYVVGSLIVPADGAETIKTLLVNHYGVPVLDNNGAAVDQYLNPFLAGGDINTAMIVGYTSMDESVKTYVKTALKAVGTFRFSDDR